MSCKPARLESLTKEGRKEEVTTKLQCSPDAGLTRDESVDEKKRILLVDDHPVIRYGLGLIINQQEDLVVSGEANDVLEAMSQIQTSKPDLAVTDLSMEGKSGMELIEEVQTLHPTLPVLVMSMHDEAVYAERVLRAGARGYVMKKAGGHAILQAIRQVLGGKVYLSDRMAEQVLQSFSGHPAPRSHSPIHAFTDREFQVFKLMGEGKTTSQIAARLEISPKTVDVYRQSLKGKLKLTNSVSLVQHAVRWVESESGV